ncbi:MAG: hypothetical protein NC133_01990 [Prevotella sp.]|nr:hypothetical protein [Prevotella sp.]
MKLGKEALLAIVESALFIIGAFFFMLVLIIPSNPVWALVFGILFGLAGAIVWLCPFVIRLVRKIKLRQPTTETDIASIAQKIQGADNPENNSYELHRSASYENLDDEIVAVSNVAPQPKTKSKPKTANTTKLKNITETEPKPEPEPDSKAEQPAE